MFTKKRRGRPRGETEQGAAARQRLYDVAVSLIATRGYDATTLRDIAAEADVSVGLLYRYFPNKRAVVMALYDELSGAYAEQARAMKPGPWRDRFVFALKTSLKVLGRKRDVLTALTGVMVGDQEQGIFAATTGTSRGLVQGVFVEAVRGADDAPAGDDVEPLGQLLYGVHMAVILWWMLDKSAKQRATTQLVSLLERGLPLATMGLRLGAAWPLVRTASRLFREGLFGEKP